MILTIAGVYFNRASLTYFGESCKIGKKIKRLHTVSPNELEQFTIEMRSKKKKVASPTSPPSLSSKVMMTIEGGERRVEDCTLPAKKMC